MKEIQLEDNKDIRSCYLYKMSQGASLKDFKHLIFIANPEDKHCPLGSARMQVNVEGK